MSLFKAREWWSTTAGSDEEYDHGALCVANIDNSSNNADKIIVGSFHGFLRIYNPHPVKTETGWSGFKAEDVLCEMQINSPILQIEAGKFVSGSDSLHIAVLQPRKLSVYSVCISAGMVAHGVQYQLKLAYEHNLQRTAFCFCVGPFGGVKGRDFLCVQSMDGTVSFFEQESFAFSRFLPGALLPGPLRYLPKTDSFVTVSSSRQVESYKYQVLAVATDAKTKEESQSLKTGKKVASDWTFNVGEQALALEIVSFQNAPLSIYVLGDRNLFCLSENGKLRFMKKLEYNPSCFLPYASVSEGSVNCLVASHTQTLMVYQDATLKWASQLESIPVDVKVANFTDLKGVIVTLDETGKLQCLYMGTDPAMFTAKTPVSSSRFQYNIADVDAEMKELQRKIKEHSHKGVIMPKLKIDDEVTLDAHVPYNLDNPSKATEVDVQDEDPIPSITVRVQLRSKSHVSNVKLNVEVPVPLVADQSTFIFSTIEPNRPGEADIIFHLRQDYLPANLQAEVTASYQNTAGSPRVAHISVRLPLKLVVKPCIPVKNASYKITLDTNKNPVNLNDLYPDLLGENAAGQGNALGFQIYGGPVVTVLASKTSQRYRLQSDLFEGLWLIANEMVNRLNSHFHGRKQTDFKVSFEGQMPLHEYFETIDRHFECRLREEHFKQLLSDRATQFRAIQRRLLTRFKDKTPSPLQNLDTLLDGSYRQLLALADKTEENKVEQQRQANALSCGTNLINLLIKLWTDMSEQEFAVLNAAMQPHVSDSTEQGWEEMVDSAITHLLRTALAKSAKDQTVNPSPLAVPKDTSKLKKHVALLCDRLSKGARLIIDGMEPVKPKAASARPPGSEPVREPVRASNFAPRQNVTEDGLAEDIPEEIGTGATPPGSRYGESLPSGRKDLPPLNGPSRGAPSLAPLSRAPELPDPTPDFGRGHDFMKKKKEPKDDIPDLDELGGTDDTLVNGSNELVYGL